MREQSQVFQLFSTLLRRGARLGLHLPRARKLCSPRQARKRPWECLRNPNARNASKQIAEQTKPLPAFNTPNPLQPYQRIHCTDILDACQAASDDLVPYM